MAKVIAIDELKVENTTSEKKATLKAAFGAWDKGDKTTLQWFKLAEKHNAKKPMEWLQNFSQICGLWCHQIKKGEKIGAGYRTVLNGCEEYGSVYEHYAYHRFAQFLCAVAKAGNNEEKRIKAAAEKAEKARLAALEAERIAALTPEQKEAEELARVALLTEQSSGNGTVQLSNNIPVADLVNDILEIATSDLDSIEDLAQLKAAYRETLRKLAVLA